MRLVLQFILISTLLIFGLCCGGGGSGTPSLANGDGISGTGDFKLSKVDLAHDSYGSGANNDFEVNTLAPVLHLTFSNDILGKPENLFKVKMTDLNINQSIEATPGSAALNSLQIVSGKTGKDFYIHIPKSKKADLGKFELRPGHHYRFEVSAVDGQRLIQNGASASSVSGYLRVKNVTLTYAGNFINGDTLIRDDAHLRGIKSLNPEFLIHSRYPLASSSADASPLDIVQMNVGGVQVLKSDSSTNYFEVLEKTSTFSRIRLAPSSIYWGQSIELQVQPRSVRWITDSGIRSVDDKDVPNKLTIETELVPELSFSL